MKASGLTAEEFLILQKAVVKLRDNLMMASKGELCGLPHGMLSSIARRWLLCRRAMVILLRVSVLRLEGQDQVKPR